jgi:glycosyltransferase involved in cell wall biosynthesis
MIPISIDLIVPCYNPPKNWVTNLISQIEGLDSILEKHSISLIIVNDGSEKDIQDEISHLKMVLGKRLIFLSYSKNKGKGYALRQGVGASTSDLVVYTDIDIPYELESMADLIEELDRGTDVVVGERELEYFESISKGRSKISRMVRRIIDWMNLPVKDTQCGLKGFRGSAKNTFLRTKINRFLFDMEFIFLLSKQKEIHLKSVPVKLRNGVVLSKVNASVLATEAWNFFTIIIRK